VGLSPAFATEEVDRFTFRAPAQATAYFYGYTKLMDLRAAAERALGPRFEPLAFHDAILAQGLVPPDLLRKAVLDAVGASEQRAVSARRKAQSRRIRRLLAPPRVPAVVRGARDLEPLDEADHVVPTDLHLEGRRTRLEAHAAVRDVARLLVERHHRGELLRSDVGVAAYRADRRRRRRGARHAALEVSGEGISLVDEGVVSGQRPVAGEHRLVVGQERIPQGASGEDQGSRAGLLVAWRARLGDCAQRHRLVVRDEPPVAAGRRAGAGARVQRAGARVDQVAVGERGRIVALRGGERRGRRTAAGAPHLDGVEARVLLRDRRRPEEPGAERLAGVGRAFGAPGEVAVDAVVVVLGLGAAGERVLDRDVVHVAGRARLRVARRHRERIRGERGAPR